MYQIEIWGPGRLKKTSKDVISWDGYCYVHENITLGKINRLKKLHPGAKIIVHSECPKPVRDAADFIGSIAQMLKYARQFEGKEFIVGTEDGLIHRLQKENPDKRFYPVGTICRGMKETTPEDIATFLEEMRYRIEISEDIRVKAKDALDKMIDI